MKVFFLHFFLLLLPSGFLNGQALSIEQKARLKYAKGVQLKAEKDKDTLLLAEAFYLYGKINEAIQNYRKSAEWFYKSLKIQEKLANDDKIARLYLRLHEIEFKQSHSKTAIEFIKKAEFHFKKINKEKGIMEVNMALGSIYSDLSIKNSELRDSSILFFNKAKIIANKHQDELSLTHIYNELGALLLRKGQKESIRYFEQAIYLQKKLGQESPLVNNLINLTSSYIQFNEINKAKKNIKLIDSLVASGIDIEPKNIAYLAFLKSNYFVKLKDWQQAYHYLNQGNTIQQNVLLADQKGAVSELNIKYDTNKKNELLVLKEKNLNMQQRFIWILLFTGILALIISIIFYQLYRKNKILNNRNSLLLKEQNHRVKNNLQVISSLLNLQANDSVDPNLALAFEDSQRRIEAMVALHRQLYENESHLGTIDLKNYVPELVDIILRSFRQNFTANYDLKKRYISADQATYLGLIINELVTNACKYAFPNNDSPQLTISSVADANNTIKIIVHDNGVTSNISKNTQKKKSFGSQLIAMLADQLNGKIIAQNESGLKVTITFIDEYLGKDF